MIAALAVVIVVVEDQDEALAFSTDRLGLEHRSDELSGPGMRWVTVASDPEERPDGAEALVEDRYGNAFSLVEPAG